MESIRKLDFTLSATLVHRCLSARSTASKSVEVDPWSSASIFLALSFALLLFLITARLLSPDWVSFLYNCGQRVPSCRT